MHHHDGPVLHAILNMGRGGVDAWVHVYWYIIDENTGMYTPTHGTCTHMYMDTHTWVWDSQLCPVYRDVLISECPEEGVPLYTHNMVV